MAYRNSLPGSGSGVKRPAVSPFDSPSSKRSRTDSGPGPTLDPLEIRDLLLSHGSAPAAWLQALEAQLAQTPEHEHPDLYRVLIDQAGEQALDIGERVYTVLLHHHQLTQSGELNESGGLNAERLLHFGVSLALRALQPPPRPIPGPPGFHSLPPEVLHGIAWQLGHLDVVDEHTLHTQHTRLFHAALLNFMLSHRQAARRLAPMMRVVRWCLQANALWRTSQWQATCEHLMRRPLSLMAPTAPGGLCIPEERHARITSDWLDAVILAAVYLGREGHEPIRRLFEAARDPRSAQARTLSHLPLHELELRLMHAEPSMNTYLMGLGDVDVDPIPLNQPSLALLLQHLPTAAPEVQLFVLGSLMSSFEDFDDTLQQHLGEFMSQHASELRGAIDCLIRWRTAFFEQAPGQVDPGVVAEIVRALQAVPLLGGELSVLLLQKLCGEPPLRNIAGDATLIRLLERLMLNFSCLSDDLHELRMDYLLNAIPPELGVPAFMRLPVLQRARLLRTGYGEVYEPYLRAFATDTQVDRGVRLGVLHFLTRRLQEEAAGHATVDLVNKLQTLV